MVTRAPNHTTYHYGDGAVDRCTRLHIASATGAGTCRVLQPGEYHIDGDKTINAVFAQGYTLAKRGWWRAQTAYPDQATYLPGRLWR
jgi:hypothetical protein